MKILHTSDWHLGRTLESISRIDEQSDFIDFLCNVCSTQNIDMVIIAGDVFDTYNPSARAEELYYGALERLNEKGRRPVIVVAGNHDNPDRLCAASPLAKRNGIFLVGYPSTDPGELAVDTNYIKVIKSGSGWVELALASFSYNIVIATLPYPSESRLNEVLSKEASEEALQKAYSERIGEHLLSLSQNFKTDTVNIIVSHIFVGGGKVSESERTLAVGGALTISSDMLPSNAHYIALGHLHRPQEIKNALSKTYYSGSPLAYSFSETDYIKGMYIVDAIPEREVIVEQCPITCTKPLKKWTVTSIEEAILWAREGRDSNAWIDLELNTHRVLTGEEQRLLKQLNPGIINIRPILKGELEWKEAQIPREGRSVEELFKDFYRSKMDIDVSDELMSMLLEIINDDVQNDNEQHNIGEVDMNIADTIYADAMEKTDAAMTGIDVQHVTELMDSKDVVIIQEIIEK